MEVEPTCVDWDNIYEDYDLTDGNLGVVNMELHVALKYRVIHTTTTRNKYQF